MALPPERSARQRLKLSNWRVPVRLVALIVIPATLAAMLAGLRVRDSVQDAAVFSRIEQMATLGDKMGTLVGELQDERDLTVEQRTRASGQRAATLREQYGATDRASGVAKSLLSGIGDGYPAPVLTKINEIRFRLDSLPTMRQAASKSNASAAFEIYSQSIETLLEFGDLPAQGSPDAALAESTRALAALARAKDAASQERAVVTMAMLNGRFVTPADRERLLGIRSLQDSQFAVFRGSAVLSQRQLYDDTVTGPEIGQVESMFQEVLISSGGSQALSVRPLGAAGAARWNQASTARINQMRAVESRLAASVIQSSRSLKNYARFGALTDGGLLLVGLLLVLLLTVLVARSLVRPLRRLRTGALEVADVRLPGLVSRLRDAETAPTGIEVEPIDIDSTDEIGEVARAFDEVHREAVRLAAEEAVLRGNINAMFVNLSRRSQSLIERQLRLIDELEQSEQDEDRLASLFRLDHLATRMRRNCENLLVLGGQEQVRRWNQAVPLIDIVRASLSEVEQYERVGLRIQGEVSVAGQVVNDLVHLVAELVENAITFSADHTRVTASGHLLSGGGAMLQITDNGVGMSPEELEEANWRLANPPVVDFSAARRMGLFVVGRLAVRHGIRVELRAALSGGLTAFVLLPPQAVAHGAETSGAAPRRFGAETAPATVGAGAAPRPLGAPSAAPAIPPPRDSGSRPGNDPYGRPNPVEAEPHPMFGGQAGPQQRPGNDPYAGQSGGYPAPGDTGGYPARQGDTGGFPRHGDTGGFPRQGDTGGFPRQGDTGGFPRQGDTGGFPRQGDTGGYPAQGDTGAHPLFGQTGPHPAVPPGGTGPMPAVPTYQESAPNQPLPQRPPGASGMRPGGTRPGGGPGSPGSQAGGTGPMPAVPQQPRERGLPGFADSGPPPAVSWGGGDEPPPSPPARAPERSPIFDAMESEWFQRRNPAEPGGEPGRSGRDPVASPSWQSPGDDGWKVAEAARQPTSDGRTSAGLPKRVPGKNRVPGSVARPAASAQQAAAPPPPPQEQQPSQSADFVRNRFASLQRGAYRGRAEARSAGPEDPLDPPARGGNEQGGGA